MRVTELTGHALREMMVLGTRALEDNRKGVDAMNVFPVPDGDTGTNMFLTLNAAIKEMQQVQSDDVKLLCEAISRGALRGARGNSGVILSQIFRGFFKALSESETPGVELFAKGMQAASDTAYRAVLKPKEGTMLTVVRIVAESCAKSLEQGGDIVRMMDALLEDGKEILKKTPDMLPVLKQAGVVDAGGCGLLIVFSGWRAALTGEALSELPLMDYQAPGESMAQMQADFEAVGDEIAFGYCTEYIIQGQSAFEEDIVFSLRDKLDAIGDSVVVVGDGDTIKVHAHSNEPGNVLQMGLALGALSAIKIDNMREQHRSVLENNHANPAPAKNGEPKAEIAVVAVASGKGLADIFRDMMASEIVPGGQTMNPSTGDIAEAIESAHANNVLVLPNNSNIIRAAQQAGELSESNVVVIPTRSMPQGLAAILAFNPDAGIDENERQMTQAATQVKTGEVTFAVRDFTSEGGLEVKKDDLIGIFEKNIVCKGSSVEETSLELLGHIVDEDDSVIMCIYGQDVPEEEAEALSQALGQRYPHCDVELVSGGQPFYYYLFSVE